MKQILLMIAVVALVGCGDGKEESEFRHEPRLRSEKVITPDEAANKLFVEAVELFHEAVSKETNDIPAAIEIYEQALAKLNKITSEHKHSDLAVKLVSGEEFFAGRLLKHVRTKPRQLAQDAAVAKEIAAAKEIIEKAIHKELKNHKDKLTVRDLEKLTALHLDNTQITDLGLTEVAKLKNLSHLSLFGTEITDVGLGEVAKMENLTYLGLFDCKQITDAGVAELQRALPRCEVIR